MQFIILPPFVAALYENAEKRLRLAACRVAITISALSTKTSVLPFPDVPCYDKHCKEISDLKEREQVPDIRHNV
jgi:hypothetical protein